jgi:hypothetical protein
LGYRVILENLLLQNQSAILERWFNLILETYPANTAALMRKEKNRFANPVGVTISREIEALFKGLLENKGSEELAASLIAILKIRSVQDFRPSQAVGFILLLKKAIEGALKSEIHREPIREEWLKFHSRIDELALLAFDLYMDCREKICEIRIHKAQAEREMAFKMMERTTFLKEKAQKGED